MNSWVRFPHHGEYPFTAARVKNQWAELHRSDAEPLPQDAKVLSAWALFHSGEFQKAARAGLQVNATGTRAGLSVAHRAMCTQALFLEPHEAQRIELFLHVANSAQEQTTLEPNNPSAHYWQAYALGQYSQSISVAKALAQGIGARVKRGFERAIQLAPHHADSHTALGAFHAEVIDKVGMLIGAMTYGVRKDLSLKHLQESIRLSPDNVQGLMAYANAIVMLEGTPRTLEATALYQKASSVEPLDARMRLEVEVARQGLLD